ncbi:MAG: hypothetical protein H5U13_08570 [Parvibaculum sp.]|nr:hypothetical protein [Parvibaculum sp.]
MQGELEAIDYLRVWRRRDERVAQDAVAMWKREGVLPEERLAGCAAIYQNKVLGRSPVEPSGLCLVGYTPHGDQLRVLWFDHHRLRSGE